MEGRTILRHAQKSLVRRGRLCVFILLSMAVACWGQASRTRTSGRFSRSKPLKVIQLPAAKTSSIESVEAVLARQQNLEAPTNIRLTFSEIGQLMWAVQGVTVSRVPGMAIPDAMMPMKIYVALPDGLYLYLPNTHALQQLRNTDVRPALARAVLTQQNIPFGGCQIIVTGSTAAFTSQYGKVGRNVMMLMGGQMVQSLQLQALSLDLTYIGVNTVNALELRRVCRLDRTLSPLYFGMFGYAATRVAEPVAEETTVTTDKKVLIVTPQREFEDQELFQTKLALDSVAVDSRVASLKKGAIVGRLGTTDQADLGLADVKVEDYDAFIFIGGPGALSYATHARVQELIRKVVAERKILAASGVAPTVLASAGVLKGARVTAFANQGQTIALAGATYTGTAVEKDGLVVTSSGAQVAPQFVRVILGLLADQ